MIPTKKQWRSWSLPSKLTLVGTYTGILGVFLSVFFFLLPTFNKQPPVITLNQSLSHDIHITGLLDFDNYLDEALLEYPEDTQAVPELNLRLSETVSNRDYESDNVSFSHFTQSMSLDQIGMSRDEKITMNFDNKNSSLILNSSITNGNFRKEKEAIIAVLEEFTLPYVKSYRMKLNNKIVCDVNYHDGKGFKDDVDFDTLKQHPFFVWDSSLIPEDCK